MATDLADPRVDAPASPPPARRDAALATYDRSSLPWDCLVMIAGQSEDDYLRRAPEGQFCEYIDGIVYMPPRVEPLHQENVNFLLTLLLIYNARRPIGFVTSGPMALRLGEGRWVEPDVFVLPGSSRARAIEEGFGSPPALLAVEILSPSNRNYDLVTKAAAYREAGIDEVWYVDRPSRVVVVDRRVGDGPDYSRHEVQAGPIIARSLGGFWCDAAWLWQDPPPSVLDCALTVLAGPPGAA